MKDEKYAKANECLRESLKQMEKVRFILSDCDDYESEIKEAYMDMLDQTCGEYVHDPEKKERVFIGYDSRCLSAYEHALDLAVKLGWIKKKQVRR